jgi:hypothetical protein
MNYSNCFPFLPHGSGSNTGIVFSQKGGRECKKIGGSWVSGAGLPQSSPEVQVLPKKEGRWLHFELALFVVRKLRQTSVISPLCLGYLSIF